MRRRNRKWSTLRRANSQTFRARTRLVYEPLEDRIALSVNWVAGPLQAPLVNRVDNGLGDNSGSNFQEPYVSINPADPGNIAFTSHAGIRVSTNASGAFTGATFPNLVFPGGFNNGDTATAFDATGRLFWANLINRGGGGADNDIEVSQIDPTTGAQIGTTVDVNTNSGDPNNTVNDNDDKEMMAGDTNAASPFANNLYLIWSKLNGVAGTSTVVFSRSVDQGANWSTPIPISGAGEGFVWPADVGVAANGDVYVAYHSQPTQNGPSGSGGFEADGTTGQIFVRRSIDGGVTFQAATSAFTGGQADITFNVQDGGRAIPNVPVWTQGAAQPWVLPDPVRPGNVYVITSDDPTNGAGGADIADMVISRSTNDGATWAIATIPDGSGGSHQLFPGAAIDRFGNIVVMWYDDRSGALNANNHALLDVFATYSADGGVTWAPAFQINDAAFNTDYPGAQRRFPTPQNAYTPTNANETSRIGEYFAIDVFGGTAYLGWNGDAGTTAAPTGHQLIVDAFPLNGSLQITGDDAGATDDDILIRRIAGNTDFIEVLVNGARQYAGLLAGVALGISVNGLAGTDTLTIDNALGLIDVLFSYDGGASLGDVDKLVLTGNPGSPIARETYLVGATEDAGRWVFDPNGNMGAGANGAADGDELIVDFVGLEPVDSDVPVAVFDIIMNGAGNNATIEDGGMLGGANAMQVTDNNGTFETTRFANKTTVRVMGAGGADTIAADYTVAAAGLTTLEIYGHVAPDVGGQPADDDASDQLNVLGNVAGVAHRLFGQGGSDNFLVGDGDLTGINAVVNVDAGAGNDDALVVDDSGRADAVDYLVDVDSIEICADPDPLVAIAAFDGTLERARLNGTQGANQFDVTPSSTTEFFIDGNDPAGPPGDFLSIRFEGTTGRQLTNVAGNGMWEFSNRQDVKFEEIERFNFFAVVAYSADAARAGRPTVKVFDAELGTLVTSFLAYETNYREGVRIAVGDVNGDGVPEIVTAPGHNHRATIKIFDILTGAVIPGTSFDAYASSFKNGVNLAVGDVDGDGLNDLVVAPSRGASDIRVFTNRWAVTPGVPFYAFDTANALTFNRRFWAFPRSFIGGSSVAVGDVLGDGKAEIVVGAGSGMRATVKIFDGLTNVVGNTPPTPLGTILPFDTKMRGGVFVAIGNVDADAKFEIIVGAGVGGKSRVATYDATNLVTPLGTVVGYTGNGSNAPVRVAATDINHDDVGEILMAQGPDGRSQRLRRSTVTGPAVDYLFENDPEFRNGFYIATEVHGKSFRC